MPHTSSQTFRRALIEAHLIGWMVALPGQLFTHTQIPACSWFLTKNNIEVRQHPVEKTSQPLFLN